MSSQDKSETDRLEFWQQKWDSNRIGFHNKDVHSMLVKYADKLSPASKPQNIFVPLCGKSVDMKWFADQGIQTVGVEGIQEAIQQFYTEQGLEWEEKTVPALGATGKLFSSKNGMLKLYCGDIMNFSGEIAGQFEAVWDRGSLSALNRQDVDRYIKVIKGLLKAGGRILVELVEYDATIFDEPNRKSRPPPPHAMYERDLKSLYEPEYSVEFLDREACELMGKAIHQSLYLIAKSQ
ncbi:thiopurine s-methyltransferase [Plakobranchus ocellatus]|uniref:thiopurine S-methyltransferase n=1 Tax=Plakobranchus ocellatus TaxID=259542 RepID=A0AAV3ZS81_9GAST|nr:thiopurine s-methyltransferase [Plakobranchus ocellatus]